MTAPVTALARPIDPTLPSNRLAVFASAVVALVATLVTGLVDPAAGVLAAAGRGLALGVGMFLAWAIARELHPDEPMAARNAVLAYVPALLLGAPALAALLALLLAARITLRSTGRPPTPVDLGVLAVVAGFAATTAAGFVTGLALAWAVLDDSRLPDPAPQLRSQLAAIAVSATALAVSIVVGSFLTTWRGPRLVELGWLALVAAAVVVRPRTTHVETTDDRRGPLSVARLVRARMLVVVALAASIAWAGADAVPALAPAAAAVIGVGATAPRFLRPRDLGTPVEPPTGASP
ncbi:MAG: hypothetical protein KY457_10845 [Actinobacteria bacterium]|nr:hypothetical protein [Actinomycetota bacterium]